MPNRVARIRQIYAGRTIEPGETFEVRPENVKLLELLGRLESEAPAPATTYAQTSARKKRQPKAA